MQIHVQDAADGSKRRRVTHANTCTQSSPVPNNVHNPNVGSRAAATTVKASNDATRCAATRREVNVHTSSTSSMTSTGVQVQATVVESTAGAHTSSAVADTGVVPQSMIPTILSLFHGDKSILRHAGKHKTYGAMRNRFVWKGMTQAVRQWVSACHKCYSVSGKYHCRRSTTFSQRRKRL